MARRLGRRHAAVAVVAVMLAGGAWVATRDTCDASLNAHVYNPQRLQVVKECVRATGTIQDVRTEADGDYHVLLALDHGQEGLLTARNNDTQGGDLVLEPICAHAVTQADAQAACQGFNGPVVKPTIGVHVIAVGRYVLDQQHANANGAWAELHPLTSLRSG